MLKYIHSSFLLCFYIYFVIWERFVSFLYVWTCIVHFIKHHSCFHYTQLFDILLPGVSGMFVHSPTSQWSVFIFPSSLPSPTKIWLHSFYFAEYLIHTNISLSMPQFLFQSQFWKKYTKCLRSWYCLFPTSSFEMYIKAKRVSESSRPRPAFPTK